MQQQGDQAFLLQQEEEEDRKSMGSFALHRCFHSPPFLQVSMCIYVCAPPRLRTRVCVEVIFSSEWFYYAMVTDWLLAVGLLDTGRF